MKKVILLDMNVKTNLDKLIAQSQELDVTDSVSVLRIARKYQNIESTVKHNIKIAILGSNSIQLTVLALKAILLKYGLFADIYEGEYNGIAMDILDENSSFYKFQPDYVVILPDFRDIKNLPNYLCDKNEIKLLLEENVGYYSNLWNVLRKNLPNCHIYQGNFVIPIIKPLSNLEANYLFSQDSFFRQLNLELILHRPNYVNLLDFESLASYIGKRYWFDETAYFMNKSPMNLQFIGHYCNLIARQFNEVACGIKKCLVLDLDNSIWGGVVADQGSEGINLNPNDPCGEAFLFFQQYVKDLKNRGVILAVCSKNDENIAKEPFLNNPNMILKLDDISCFVANWNDKVSNLKVISNTLNIGIDSLVFFDDNPTERAIVKQFLPEVTVVDVPEDPSYYVRVLDEIAPFEWQQLTSEDLQRSNTYVDNKKREKLQMSYKEYSDYLRALELRAKVEDLSIINIERFTQLLNKSNQFNLRTQRYSEAQVKSMLDDPSYNLFSVSLSDKFSNYGIIACIILKKINDYCFVDSWVMSCRVLKKDVEKLTLKSIIQHAISMGVHRIVGEYIQTKKNSLVKNLYTEFNFNKIATSGNSAEYDLQDFSKVPSFCIKEE